MNEHDRAMKQKLLDAKAERAVLKAREFRKETKRGESPVVDDLYMLAKHGRLRIELIATKGFDGHAVLKASVRCDVGGKQHCTDHDIEQVYFSSPISKMGTVLTDSLATFVKYINKSKEERPTHMGNPT